MGTSAFTPIPLGLDDFIGDGFVGEWLPSMLRECPALGTSLRELANTRQFKPRLKAEILADAEKFYPDSPGTLRILECEVDGLPAKRLLQLVKECTAVPTRSAGRANVTVTKKFVLANLPGDALRGGEKLLARLLALAYAADHANVFLGPDLPNDGYPPLTGSSVRSNKMYRCQPKEGNRV